MLPIARDLRRYRAGGARNDVLAGVTVAALAIPSAMAYAEVAGLTPINGLYALLLPVVAYALLGSSRQLIVGPEGSLSALVAAALLAIAAPGTAQAGELAATLALLVARLLLRIARLLRLGWVADYLSRPVLVGYIHGVAVVLVDRPARQAARDPDHGDRAVAQLGEVVLEGLGDISWRDRACRRGRAGRSLFARADLRAEDARRRWSSSSAAIACSRLLDFAQHGVATVGAAARRGCRAVAPVAAVRTWLVARPRRPPGSSW